jgi:hypothetical protein
VVPLPRLITSIDFLKRERPLRLFRETLPAPGEPIYPRKYDLLIVDEAHNCAPSGVGKYATDSLRTQALRELVPHFEHKLFLTATPHNGYRESFSALLELLDNQRFSSGTEPDRKQLDAVMVRRLKSDPAFACNHLGMRRFPPRILEPIEVPYTDEEREIHAALRQYTQAAIGPGRRSHRTVRHRVCVEDAEETAVLLPRRVPDDAGAAREVAGSRSPKRSPNRPSDASAGIGSAGGRLRRRHDYDEATADALDTAIRLFAEPTADETGSAANS